MGNMSGTTTTVKRTPRYSLFMERNVLAMAILLLTIIFFTSSSSSSGGQYHSTMIKVAQAQPYQPFYHLTSRPNVTVLDCEVCGKKTPSFNCGPPIQLLAYAQWPVFVRCFQTGGQSVDGNSNWEYVCLNNGNCGFIPEAYLDCQGYTACEAPPCC
ncbi:unnamed protein product [Sphagnum jensenii]|uniref:Uncharacterized protein n=1 Tax=Sphagnum jensenii TaxID=128206 RepID=A0ABP1ATZ0_9BRYO